MRKRFCYTAILFLLTACTSTKGLLPQGEKSAAIFESEDKENSSATLSVTFAGDIMAHTPNHKITGYDKIWSDVKKYIEDSDLAFANIESPLDATRPVSSYPNFNMPEAYVQAAIDAGFDVFSLANNHSFDQFEGGIRETIRAAQKITERNAALGKKLYFSGLKESKDASYSYSIVEKNGWKILFLPVTGILNYPHDYALINYVRSTEKSRGEFAQFCRKLREENPCDLFIISMHADEPEYKRPILKSQRDFYLRLLNEGNADVVWANHAHIIKDREFIFDSESGRQKLIMYANGNTISAQRTNPTLNPALPMNERDHTGDGLLYLLEFVKTKDCETRYNSRGEPEHPLQIRKARPVFITTYINTAWEFVLKPCDQDFVDYLRGAGRSDWAGYIERRIKVNHEETKDLITWQ